MTEAELRSRWESGKPIYEAWGEFILSEVKKQLSDEGKSLDVFLKVPASKRLKSVESLIDKAFYRDKNYEDPYEQIEDKIGVRFVVLLLDDIKIICDLIEKCDLWEFEACKHFDDDKEKQPLLFTYQSVHYVLRPKKNLKIGDLHIPTNTPCEVQIRTLLQHAHAELTHDAIYKSKKKIKPSVQRTVAKSMALIETTDEFFVSATHALNFGALEEHKIIGRMDGLYQSFTKRQPHVQKSTLIIWDEYEELISENLVESIQNQLVNNEKYRFLSDVIADKYNEHNIRQQSVVLFLYWMLIFKKRRLLTNWPFSKEIVEILASDVGISLPSN